MERLDTLVVGGGLAGIACALALAGCGQRVALVEREPVLGGRAGSLTDALTGERIDLGPHILLSAYRNMLDLLRQLGTAGQVVWQDDEQITLADRPHPVGVRLAPLPAPFHLLPSLLRAPQVSWLDLASNARLLWQVIRLDRGRVLALDGIDGEALVRRLGVRPRFVDWFWRSATMAVMNVPLEQCSAGALLNFFRYMAGIRRFRIGFPGVGLADLFAAPARQRLEEAGGCVLPGRAVRQVLEREGRAAGVRLADGTCLHAHHCVLALPPAETGAVLPPHWRTGPLARLGEFAPSPYVSTYLWFDRPLPGRRFWTRVWSPDNLNYDFYDLSQIRPGRAGDGALIASNIIHAGRAATLDDDAVVAATLRELVP